jgi:hypothetical protein
LTIAADGKIQNEFSLIDNSMPQKNFYKAIPIYFSMADTTTDSGAIWYIKACHYKAS